MKLRAQQSSIGPIAALVLVAGLAGVAISGQLRTTVLFHGTFDTPGVLPEVGQFVASSNVGSIGILPSPNGGNLLVFDDTGTNGSQPLYLLGTFDGGKKALNGTVDLHLELTLGQSDSPFSVGVVVDNATSDFIPASGPDGDGDLTIAGKKTGKKVPVDTPLAVDVQLSRERTTDDWSYAITVASVVEAAGGKGPSAITPTYTGVFPGTRGKDVSGIAFIKMPGSPGRFYVDDISVEQSTKN